ncbi:MAG: hypothetical protein U5L00_18345 [Desulfovermiculus sp.]|nr:hypothetical protein [Desulfovermiculus sp.]
MLHEKRQQVAKYGCFLLPLSLRCHSKKQLAGIKQRCLLAAAL